ncbi:MAG TPA: phosphatase PAP2 family protein [Streptosporangiaceae bacterium]
MEQGRWRPAGQRPTPGPLIALRAQPAAATVAVLCAVVLTALAIRYAGHTQAGPLDARIDGWAQGHLGITSPTLRALTLLGDPAPVTVMTLLIALGCARARWWRAVVLTVLATPAASGLTEDVLKPAIGRTIDGALSMPSGHTCAVFTLATLGVVLLRPRPPGPLGSPRRLIVLAAYVLAVAVAVAMVAQGFHYFTDTVGGAAVGTGTVLAVALAIDAAAGPVRTRLAARADTAGHRAHSTL